MHGTLYAVLLKLVIAIDLEGTLDSGGSIKRKQFNGYGHCKRDSALFVVINYVFKLRVNKVFQFKMKYG